MSSSALESRIRSELLKHLRGLGYRTNPKGLIYLHRSSKHHIRLLHQEHRRAKLEKAGNLISRWSSYSRFFADGSEIQPFRITPRLEAIKGKTWQSDLFRLATLTWSVPVSSGFGRRIRFLVWDDNCGKLMGVLGLGDPVFNLGARDRLIGWNADERKERLVHVMDAFVLGALNNDFCARQVVCVQPASP